MIRPTRDINNIYKNAPALLTCVFVAFFKEFFIDGQITIQKEYLK